MRRYVDRAAIYAGLGVKELWLWQGEGLSVFVLRANGRFARTRKSRMFPTLDVALLASFARRGAQTAAVREFRATVRKG